MPWRGRGCDPGGVKLADLPEPHAGRVKDAEDAAAWGGRCVDARGEAWLAWNVREDGWYGVSELDVVAAAIAEAPPELTGPSLLLRELSPRDRLRRLRRLTDEERGRLPDTAVNHVLVSSLGRRYERAEPLDWGTGGIAGEARPAIVKGERLDLQPRDGADPFVWITFEANGNPVPRSADQAIQQLGLCWGSTTDMVVRLEIPVGALRAAGALFALPTLFDALEPGKLQYPDWRARPESERRPNEPWGSARDMSTGVAALPEVITEITRAGIMDAHCLGALKSGKWSTRPYLAKGPPR